MSCMLPDNGTSNNVSTCFASHSCFNPYRLPCGHSLCHVDTLKILLEETVVPKKTVKCPTCRIDINARPGINYALRDVIHNWLIETDADFNFEEWKCSDGYEIICCFFSPQSGEVLEIK